MPASSLGYHGRAPAPPTTVAITVVDAGGGGGGGGWVRDALGVLLLVAAGVGVGLWAAFAR